METVDFKYLNLTPGDKILDIGCGEGRHTIGACLNERVHAIGLDLSLTDLNTARKRYREFEVTEDSCRRADFLAASGLRLPFADGCFDQVICSEVLEHIHDYKSVLREIHRVLKPGGLFAVSVPRFGPEWCCWRLSSAYHAVAGGHVRIFRTTQLQQAIESFSMVRYARHWAHGLHTPYWWLRCLFWSWGDQIWPVRTYHRLLVWDLLQQPRLTSLVEKILNPFIGKSLVLYFVRDDP
ncbi:MAG: class I SAM-dependent methyltransferase [Gammaproteobacteria bacterium]|nr:class I SAM-dependent methyltransferase [Gammaproteobacteria bacterium]